MNQKHLPTALRYLITAFILLAQASPCYARHGYLKLQFQTQHSSKTSVVGEPFHASLADTYCITPGDCLEKDTLFSGHIIGIKHPHRFDRPGELDLGIESVGLANGLSVDLSKIETKTIINYTDEQAHKLPSMILGQTSGAVVDYGATAYLTELNEVWRYSPRVITLAVFGLDAAFCITQEFIHPSVKSHHPAAKVGMGILEATGLPDIVYLFRKEPDAVITNGSQIRIKLKRPVRNYLSQHIHDLPPVLSPVLSNERADIPLPDNHTVPPPPAPLPSIE